MKALVYQDQRNVPIDSVLHARITASKAYKNSISEHGCHKLALHAQAS